MNIFTVIEFILSRMVYAQIQLGVIHVNAKLDTKGTEEVAQILMSARMEHINAREQMRENYGDINM